MESLIDHIKSNNPSREFKPVPIYSPDGDSLTVIFEDAPYYRDRIDDFLTVYRALDRESSGGEKDRLVGCQLKGLPEVLQVLGAFDLTINNQPIKLTLIFLSLLHKTPQEVHHLYLDLAKRDEFRRTQIPSATLKQAA